MPTQMVQRKVFFYRASLESRDHTRDEGATPFDPHALCERLKQLKFQTPGDRYQVFPDGDAIAAWPNTGSGRPRLYFGSIRRSGLPEIEETGQHAPLVIGQNQGLIEKTHVVFFENNIVGAEYNFYGPRMTKLTGYLSDRLSDHPVVLFDPLLNRDVVRRLEHLEDVRIIQLRIRRDHLDVLAEAKESLHSSLRTLEDDVQAPVIELVLRSTPRSRQNMGDRAKSFVMSLAGAPKTREAMDLFRVQGVDDRIGKPSWFDLLEDKFVSVRGIVKEKTKHRAIDTNSMYTEIINAYEELRSELESAAGLSP